MFNIGYIPRFPGFSKNIQQLSNHFSSIRRFSQFQGFKQQAKITLPTYIQHRMLDDYHVSDEVTSICHLFIDHIFQFFFNKFKQFLTVIKHFCFFYTIIPVFNNRSVFHFFNINFSDLHDIPLKVSRHERGWPDRIPSPVASGKNHSLNGARIFWKDH